jgi:dTDP-D-glucose 4,6-dehydratase
MVTNYKVLKKIQITGGAGFIGFALIRFLINQTENKILNLDKLTYDSFTVIYFFHMRSNL